MAQAFTREIDDAPPPPLPERPVSAHPNLVTPRGAQLIEAELERLRAELADAPAPERAALLARDLRYWTQRRATRRIVQPDPAPKTVGFGTAVALRRRGGLQRLRIVGEDEADPAAGLLSWTAPLARAIEGAEAGESVVFEAGGRGETLLVVAVGEER